MLLVSAQMMVLGPRNVVNACNPSDSLERRARKTRRSSMKACFKEDYAYEAFYAA